MLVDPPRKPGDYPDRATDCQIALTGIFDLAMTDAIHSGWTEDESAFALLCLAIAAIKAREANLDTDEAIARAIRAVGNVG